MEERHAPIRPTILKQNRFSMNRFKIIEDVLKIIDVNYLDFSSCPCLKRVS